MHFTCRPFIGRSDPLHWCQYWENEPDDPSLVSQKGHLFGLIYLAPSSPLDNLSLLGRQIIDQISADYYTSSGPHPFSHLSSPLTFPNILLPPETQISLALAVVQGQRLHLAAFNPVDIFLRRGDQISHLLTNQEPLIQTLSGPILASDQLFLSTHSFFSAFSLDQINSTLSLPSLQNIEENFLSRLNSFTDQAGLAAALIQINFDENESPPPSPPPAPVIQSTVTPKLSSPLLPRLRLLFGRFKKRFFRRRSEYVPSPQVKTTLRRHRLRLLVAAALILAILASSYLGYRRNQSRKLEARYLNLKSQLDQKINDAQTIKNLNLDSSLESARQAENILGQMLPLKIHLDQVTSYQNQIKSLLAQTGSPDSLNLPLFYDTSLLANQSPYSRFLFTSDHLYLLDSTSGRIDLVNLPAKSTQKVITSDSVKNSLALLFSQKNLYLLKPDGFYLVNPNNISRLIDFTQGQKPITPVDAAFWNGSLYLLDSQNQTIWKFAPNSTGFSPPQDWLKSKEGFPQSPISLAINGNVWLISRDGQISSYLRGQPQDFKTSSVYHATNAIRLVTNPDSDKFAFVADDSFIYVYKKDGQSQAKFNLSPQKILDLALSSDSKDIYLLSSDQKIYKIAL